MRKRRLSRAELKDRVDTTWDMYLAAKEDFFRATRSLGRSERKAALLASQLKETEARALRYATELDEARERLKLADDMAESITPLIEAKRAAEDALEHATNPLTCRVCCGGGHTPR